jgi:hypothetical protein
LDRVLEMLCRPLCAQRRRSGVTFTSSESRRPGTASTCRWPGSPERCSGWRLGRGASGLER